MTTFKSLLFTAILALMVATTACQPAPSRVLNEDEKTADMLWLFSIFDQNYAPRELKEKTFEFDYDELKDTYLEQALATGDNEAFYAVMHGFVAEFHDAHTSSSLVASTLPGRTKIAYLGFNGVRQADHLSVTELLPTTATSASFPIHIGDEIIALDGKPLRDVVLDDMVKYRSLGYDEANLTYHMNGIFTRTPLVTPLPTKPDAVLKVLRNGSEKTITLPWVVRDLQTFLTEQTIAAAGNDELFIGGVSAEEFLTAATELMESDDLTDVLDVPVAGLPHPRAWNYFKFVDNMPTLSSPSLLERVREHIRSKTTKTSVEDIQAFLSSVRNVPSDAIVLPDSPTYPTYIAQFPGELPLRPFYAYMLLNNFTPVSEPDALLEIEAVLARLQAMGIKHIIIDTIDNGGGSLAFGMQAARLFSKEPLELPLIQYKTNETWIDKFETDSIFAPSDAEKELARRVMDKLKAARDAGKVVAEPMSIDTLMPFQFIDGNESLTGDMEIALLVNEMCVSMCDIFAATMQDNELATIIGKRTMGGGGNVVQYAQAPNSHLAVAQTESLILRTDGTPIENIGVTPDIEMEVNETAFARYDDIRQKAIDVLNPCQVDCAPADDAGDKASDRGGCSVGGRNSGAAATLLLLALAFATRRRRRVR